MLSVQNLEMICKQTDISQVASAVLLNFLWIVKTEATFAFYFSFSFYSVCLFSFAFHSIRQQNQIHPFQEIPLPFLLLLPVSFIVCFS